MGYRLACRTFVSEDLSIEIPEESIFEHDLLILATEDGKEKHTLDPFVKKKFFQMPEPSLEDPIADLENIKKAVGNFDLELKQIQEIPSFLRENNFSGTAVLCNKKLISLEHGNTETENFAVAIDLGTTSIVAALLDINSGKQLATRGILNPQVRFGDDVLTRICSQAESPKKLEHLQKDAVSACNRLINELCRDSGISAKNIYSISIAGNTVMECLICGIPVNALGKIPFVPPFSHSLNMLASDLGIETNPRADVYIFPVIGGFVGGDIVSGILASGLKECSRPTLFVDVGTNGEIVLAVDSRLYAASAAAGPAFEGARIESGMRASSGAIEKILIEKDTVQLNVIGNTEPKGICGTALIDAAAEMLRCGILDETGRILSPEECPRNLSTEIRRRIRPSRNAKTWNFLLTPSKDYKKEIHITQKDIRELQLATGAIRAAINILLKKVGLEYQNVNMICLAGGFGNYIRRTHAKRIGLIPNLPDTKIHFIGNTSLIGAKAVLLSQHNTKYVEEIAKNVNYIEVSLDSEFQMEFATSMVFPPQNSF